MIQITIPLEPRTKKNSQNIFTNKQGNRFISTSKAYKEYVNECIFLVRQKDSELPFPISGPVNVKGLFFVGTRKKVDLINLLSCLCDVLVTFGVLEDDNCTIAVSHDGSRVFYDKNDPRTEIYIEKTSPNDSMIPPRKTTSRSDDNADRNRSVKAATKLQRQSSKTITTQNRTTKHRNN